MNQPEAAIKSWPLPRGGVGGGPSIAATRTRAAPAAYFDNIAQEAAS
jgi:hypothetical protein